MGPELKMEVCGSCKQTVVSQTWLFHNAYRSLCTASSRVEYVSPCISEIHTKYTRASLGQYMPAIALSRLNSARQTRHGVTS